MNTKKSFLPVKADAAGTLLLSPLQETGSCSTWSAQDWTHHVPQAAHLNWDLPARDKPW